MAKGGTLFSDVCYIIVSYSLRSDSGLSHMAIPAKRKGALSTQMRNVLPGDKSPTQESLKALIYGTDIYLSPMHASSEVAHKIFSSLRPYKLNIPEAVSLRRGRISFY
ncbi:hypothetical protein R3W88_032221 [Solanum pinnatisectum]|uniref:Uncharacterized protein n=1 Tax=Solanum pinnatisectum TaxID=50273 RepID=A0AAV9LQG0_9SOLN|nr:hypothetical protein R3W88_032221 [Solanum pinnatisectum]